MGLRTSTEMVAVVLVLIGFSLTASYRTERSPMEKRVEYLYWNSAMVLDKHEYHTNSTATRVWLTSSAQIAKTICKELFLYDPWGCHYDKFTFHTVSRETGFLYSILTSSLAHYWTTHAQQLIPFKDKLHQGISFTKQYLDLRNNLTVDLATSALQFDSALGLDVLPPTVQVKCKCHGLTGSCSVKTCWPTLPPLRVAGELLKYKYYTATEWTQPNSLPPYKKQLGTQIAFVHKSNGPCTYPRERPCENKMNCLEICCGRGFFTLNATKHVYCRCSWEYFFRLSCDVCTQPVELHYCR